MNDLQRYLTRIRTMWANLSSPYRFVVLAVATLIVVSTIVITVLSTTTEYVPLATGLTAEEIGPITAQLDSAGIPYRAEASGSTILVPKDRALKARVALNAAGVTSHGGKGFELFDDTSIITTPFVQKVNYNRALQAELARSITQLEPVAGARVLIARGEPTPFVRDQQQTTASVVIKLKPGAAIAHSMAAGIVSLVARSVEGLRPENVTVVDSSGRLLSEPHTEGDSGASSAHLTYRRELETYLAAKAEEMLARHLGPGRAIVRVSADLNHQKMRETRERYSPDERVARTEHVTSTNSGGGEARGAAGTGSNFVRTGGSGSSGSGKGSHGETSSLDYLVSKTTQELEADGGALQRMTVAVLVDLSAESADQSSETLLTPADAEDIVKKAIGFQTGRDEIKVANAHLAGIASVQENTPEMMWVERAQAYVRLARNIAMAVGLIVIGAIGVLLVRRVWPAARKVEPDASPAPPEPDRFSDLADQDPDQIARVLTSLLGMNGRP